MSDIGNGHRDTVLYDAAAASTAMSLNLVNDHDCSDNRDRDSNSSARPIYNYACLYLLEVVTATCTCAFMYPCNVTSGVIPQTSFACGLLVPVLGELILCYMRRLSCPRLGGNLSWKTAVPVHHSRSAPAT